MTKLPTRLRGLPNRNVEDDGFEPALCRLPSWADAVGVAAFALRGETLDGFELLHVSERFASVLGLEPRALVREPVSLFSYAIDSGLTELKALLEEAARGARRVEWVGDFETPGGFRQIEWVSVPAPDGELTSTCGSYGWLREVTDELDEVAERRGLLKRHSLSQLSIGSGFGFWDQHVATGKMSWSAGQRALFGVGPREAIPTFRELATRVSPAMFERVETLFSRAVESGEAFEIEWQFPEAEGERRYVLMRGQAVRGPDGQTEWIVGSSFDVTNQRLAERAARESEQRFLQAQKMEAVGRLAGGVAHDFNNLLTAIRGFTELAMGQLDGADPAREDLVEVIESTRRAQLLTRKLVTVGRKQVVRKKPLSVNRTISDMEPLLRRTLGDDITLELDLEPSSKSVRGDSGSVEQVVLNLAINARDAMPHGGVLEISTRRWKVEDLPIEIKESRSEYLALRVSDTGWGIGHRELGHIFEPFFTTKPTGKGTGLGLATVYGIVEDMSGGIHVESQLKKGTVMSIFLPLVEEAVVEESLPVPERHRKGSETILVVEDDHRVRRFTTRSLESLGYQILQAENGPAALEQIEAGASIDLLFTDVVMPGMSGTEVARRALEVRPGLRVLFTTGFTQDRLILHGLDLGRDGVLLKPFTLAQLSGTIREYLDAPANKSAVQLFDRSEPE